MQTLEENTLNILLKVNIIYPIDIDSETININEYLWKGTFFFIIIIFFTFFFFIFYTRICMYVHIILSNMNNYLKRYV